MIKLTTIGQHNLISLAVVSTICQLAKHKDKNSRGNTIMGSEPFYQFVIQKLPYVGSRLALVLGHLVRTPINAVVNNAVMRLDLRELIQRTMFMGCYEPIQTQWFKECVQPGDTVIDVGASFGHYTTLSSVLVGKTGRVFAFEPSPLPGQMIENAIRDSGIENIALTKAAVGKEPGEVELYLPNTGYLHSPSMLYSDDAFQAIQIPVITLDEFEPLAGVDCVKLIKIDVEGYEPDVIQGMESLIKAGRVENIVCELNTGWLRRNSSTAEQLNDYIEGLGFYIHKQTKLQKDLVGHKGELFDLQDIWYKKIP